MADAITSFFLLQANRSGSASAQIAPSALELGSDTLTRNPRLETLGKLFAPPSGASNIAGLDSFLAVATAAKTAAGAPARNSKDTLKQAPELRKNDSAALDVFIKRETAAESRLKQLLQASTAAAATSTTSKPAETEAATAAASITRNSGLRITEGGDGIINSRRLNTNIPGARPQDIIYTVNESPRNGRLELTAKPGEAVTTFTQQDLTLGRLRYVSNGSEARGDSFDFTVRGGEQELSGSFGISVAPVNDAPTVSVNTGLTVAEGDTATLTTAQLSVSDPDSRAEDTVFTVTGGPQHGRLEYAASPGLAITSFTQGDIAAGRVRYVSDGSEVTSDSFTFTASDGISATAAETFNINITPVDDSATIVNNTGATVTEGGSAVLSETQLSSTDVDTAAADIRYNVTSGPSGGYLEFTDNAGTAITSFTQADVNSGRVRYVHGGGEAPADSFNFTVTGSTATTASASFAFTVTPVDDAPQLQANNGATLNEGGTAAITAAQLSVSDVDTAASGIVYNITAGPQHGRLEYTSSPGTAVTSFTQADIDSGRIVYIHDGSETTSDSFTFTAADATTTLGASSFALNVTPVDDAPVLTNTGGTIAEGGSSIISSSQLRATDPDTAAANITYTVTTAPTTGQLESTTNPGVSITSFTQADIDAGLIRFVHDGGEASTASFGFSVSDGTTTQAGNTFTFGVTPVNDAPVLATNTGTSVARRDTTTITSAQLQTTDVDNTPSSLTYTVTASPTRGRLELSTNPGVSITSFTQADIDAGRLRYVHTANGAANDSFTFTVSDGAASIAASSFAIDVT